MRNYKVSLWFGGNEGAPDRVVYVETEERDKKAIKLLALKEVGSYPRSYEILVEPAENVESMYVIKLEGTDRANEDAWYHERDGELFVVRKFNKKYVTCHFLGNTSTTGYIDPKFCTIVTTFKAEDAF